MTQEAVQITTTPPLPGLQLVQDLNKALQTLATDFSGATDPAAMAWPYSTWADAGTGTLKRRNAANSAWAIEGRLLRAHLPMYAQADVPALDIGPIYIIGKGPAEWVGAAYKPLISGIPGATFAEVDALVADEGPIIVTDHGGAVYAWNGTKYAPLIADETYAGAVKRATTAQAQGLTDDATFMTPKKLADVMNQPKWLDVTASRAFNTVYTNTRERPVEVCITGGATGAGGFFAVDIDGVTRVRSTAAYASNKTTSATFTVPAGSTYQAVSTACNLALWSELLP